MRLKLKFSSVGALALAAVLTGCAAGPHPVVDDAKLRAVHTVTVVYPGQAVYESGTASAPILIPVGSLVVAAITHFVIHIVTGDLRATKNMFTFNDIEQRL
jgi:hypothetical protein